MPNEEPVKKYASVELLPAITQTHFHNFSGYLVNGYEKGYEFKHLHNSLKNAFRASVFSGFANLTRERRDKSSVNGPNMREKRGINLYGNSPLNIIDEMARRNINPKLSEIERKSKWKSNFRGIASNIDDAMFTDLDDLVMKFIVDFENRKRAIRPNSTQWKNRTRDLGYRIFLSHMKNANKFGESLREKFPEVAKALSGQINAEK
ncbi:hypothetical protein HY989_04410 [Candidatus Micrarchaeota archaeon]|nr:hypothetical protein [Candidatus Micrarchaeota archaeon]